jgi:hypothetical protein
MRVQRLAAVVVVCATNAPGHANPLPVVERAGDANLEPVGPHRGLTLTAVFTGSTIIAADSTGDVGRGPGLSLRVGEAMTPDTILTFELTGGSMLHDHAATPGSTSKSTFTNNSVNALVGAQYYALPSLWLRGSVGVGNYTRRGLFNQEMAPVPDTTTFGPAALFGIGIDILRRHPFVLGLEAFSSLIVESTGVVTTSGLGLSVGYQ